jgi:hypothetical protein
MELGTLKIESYWCAGVWRTKLGEKNYYHFANMTAKAHSACVFSYQIGLFS